MTRRLHAFKMESGTGMAQHLDAFDELVVGLQTLGEVVDEARQLVVLLSSLPSGYDMISSIIENAKDVSLIEVKEKLLKSISVWRRRTPRWRSRSKPMGMLISSKAVELITVRGTLHGRTVVLLRASASGVTKLVI